MKDLMSKLSDFLRILFTFIVACVKLIIGLSAFLVVAYLFIILALDFASFVVNIIGFLWIIIEPFYEAAIRISMVPSKEDIATDMCKSIGCPSDFYMVIAFVSVITTLIPLIQYFDKIHDFLK